MSAEQIILIGLIASGITFGLRVLATYLNYRPGRVVVNVVLFIVSAVLALLWSGAVIPPFPPFDSNIAAYVGALWLWLNNLIALGAPIMGSATLIYNLLYDKVVLPAFQKVAAKLRA